MKDRFNYRIALHQDKYEEYGLEKFKNQRIFEVKTLNMGYENSTVEIIAEYSNGDWAVREIDIEDVDLMQCTGLKDKNGTLIYEGDIVREYFGETGTYQVVFCPYIAQWEWVNLNDERPNWEMFSEQFEGMAIHQGISTDLEVIGNIYENPEQ